MPKFLAMTASKRHHVLSPSERWSLLRLGSRPVERTQTVKPIVPSLAQLTSKALAIRALWSGYFSQLLRPSTLPSTSTLIASKSPFAVEFVGLLCSSAFVFPRLRAPASQPFTLYTRTSQISHQLRFHRKHSLPLPRRLHLRLRLSPSLPDQP